jgi:hypothetical protein
VSGHNALFLLFADHTRWPLASANGLKQFSPPRPFIDGDHKSNSSICQKLFAFIKRQNIQFITVQPFIHPFQNVVRQAVADLLLPPAFTSFLPAQFRLPSKYFPGLPVSCRRECNSRQKSAHRSNQRLRNTKQTKGKASFKLDQVGRQAGTVESSRSKCAAQRREADSGIGATRPFAPDLDLVQPFQTNGIRISESASPSLSG